MNGAVAHPKLFWVVQERASCGSQIAGLPSLVLFAFFRNLHGKKSMLELGYFKARRKFFT
jgi:hypothetical protein